MKRRNSVQTRQPPRLLEQTNRRHLLDLDDCSMEEIETVFQTTDAMREVLARDIKKVPTLRGKMVVTIFYEPSTRTRLSFEEAAKILSADMMNISGDSINHTGGESLLNTALTIQAMGADLVIVQHPHSGAPYFIARTLRHAGVINAGDGWHAHPTQALLDMYTMRRHLGSLAGKKIVIVGDVLHSHVARSNLWGLVKVGAQVTICGPHTLLPLEMLKAPTDYPDTNDYPLGQVSVETNLDLAIEDADVVMALPVYQGRKYTNLIPSLREYSHMWQVDGERLNRAKRNVLVIHPGPIKEGVEISPQVAHGIQAHIEEQITNGVAIRMALLYMLAIPMSQEPR